MIGMRVSADIEKLDAAINRVSQTTGRSLNEIVRQSAIMFARSAGKAMPPKGRWAHPAKFEKRTIYKLSANQYFNVEDNDPRDILGTRGRGQSYMYAIMTGNPRSRHRRRLVAWKQRELTRRRKIETRNVAKAQFWEALQAMGQTVPRGTRITSTTAQTAKRNVSVTGDTIARSFRKDMPYIDIVSTLRTASGYRPFAEVVGLRSASRQVQAWGRRLKRDQQRAWN